MPRRPQPGPAIEERKFHAWLASHLRAGRSGLLPLGDDAAALRPPVGTVAVLTTDALVEGTHFLRDSPPDGIGYAAVAVSLSDLAAKGAVPAAVLLALILPPGTPCTWAAAVVRGAERASRRFGAGVVGGDTKPGPVRAVVGFGLGWGREGRLAPRSGASPGDLLAVTGTVGRGGWAAARWREGRARPRALAELLRVRPRIAEGRALVRWAHAMLDTSDGLAEAARLLASASRAKVVIDERSLPLPPGMARLARSVSARRTLTFYGGDYELLAAVAPADLEPAARAVARVGGTLTRVGSVGRGRGAWLVRDGREQTMPAAGWQPFRPARPRPG